MAPYPPAPAPPFHHHNSEGTHPALLPIQEAIHLSRERTLRAQDLAARGLRPGGVPSGTTPPAPVPPVRPSPPHHTSSSSSNESGGSLRKLFRGMRTSPASPPPSNSPYPPMLPHFSSPSFAAPYRPDSASLYSPISPASSNPHPPISPASTGPYPPFVSTATASLPAAAPHPNPYGGFVPAPPPGATHAIAPSACPPARSTASDGAVARREKSPAELEQEAVERACQQGLAAEQRRLAALAAEEERLVRLTLEESTSSAALEQLRANALARERALADERALREALLSSRSEAEGRVRSERRRRVEEEKEMQRAMAVSRRESEDKGKGKGKGKGKATAEDDPGDDEIERMERDALELAIQLSLQEEEKRRLWGGGCVGVDDGDEEEQRDPPTAAAAPSVASSSTPIHRLAPSSSLDDLPPAYELPQHARELDEPDDVIIGPGRPLPHPPAPPPPSGAAPAQLQRLIAEKHASGAYLPAHEAAYPSFAPYAHGHATPAASLVGSSSSGGLSLAASAGSFEEAAGAYSGSSYVPSVAAEPDVLDEQDPFHDRFAAEGEVALGAAGGPVDSAVHLQPQRQDLFAAVLARRATHRALQQPPLQGQAPFAVEAYPARPVLSVELVGANQPTGAVRLGEQEQTPVALVPLFVPQASSAPMTPEPTTLLSPPSPAPRFSSPSTPASPASLTSLRSDPSAGGFVEDVGALVPFADEHVLRNVRWGFVDEDTSAVGRYPRLEHEGDFPRGAQLSAVKGADGAQPYRAFAVESRTWQGLLVYLMWHGNSRFEAAPHDLQADKSGHGLQAAISVDFYRSGRSSSSAVSIRPPRVRVRLTLLPHDPNTPARRPSSSFALSGPAALQPVSPSIRLVLEQRPVLPLALADLATLLSQAHTASRGAARLSRGTSAGAGADAGADRRLVLAHAVDLFRRLNGEEVRRAEADEGGVEGAEEEVSLLDRLKARLRRRRGPRVIEGAGGARVEDAGALPEGATLITPFSLE